LERPTTRGAAIAAALGVAIIGGAGATRAADVTDVRVGIHPGFTRVVFETDSPAHFRTEKTASGEIRVHLGAASAARNVRSKSPILEGVRVEGSGEGAVATLDLRGAEVSVSEMVLTKPARIVLDLRKGAAGATSLAATKASPAPPAEKPVPKSEPQPDPKAEAAATPKPTESASAEADGTVKDAEPASDWAEGDAAGSEVAGETAPAPRVADSAMGAVSEARRAAEEARRAVEEVGTTPPAPAPEELEAELAGGLPAGERVAEAPAPSSGTEVDELAMPGEEPDAEALPSEGEDAQALPELAETSPPPLPTPAAQKPPSPGPAPLQPPPIAEPRGFTGFLPSAIDDPAIVGGIAAAVVLLGILTVMRRRRPEPEEELATPFAAEEPFSLDEAPATGQMGLPGMTGEGSGAEERSSGYVAPSGFPTPSQQGPISFGAPEQDVIGPPGGARAPQAGRPAASADDELASLFDQSEDDVSAPGGAQGESMQTTTTGFDSTTTAFSRPSLPSSMTATGPDVVALVQDLERRMKQLESQVEELLETKERLERQVAAQTEELRVQRAAIARTQRVLRTVVKPEEEATEPVPKV
jgi:hypothetical protein